MSEEPESAKEPKCKDEPRRPLSADELRHVLQAHSLWLRTRGREGKQADLSSCDLQNADLSRANLRNAKLRNTNLRGAKLSGTVFVHADLSHACLQDATGLTAPQLGGADLLCADMPQDYGFADAINGVNSEITNAGRNLLPLTTICTFSLLTIASMTDSTLVTGAGTTKIPGQDTPITTVGFYYAVPVVILLIYTSMVLYLQRMWESLVKVPAVLPDGTTICDRLAPWLPTGLMWQYYPRLKDRRPAMWWLQVGFSILVLWWIAPPILHAFWARTLCIHDAVLTSILGLIVASSIITGAGMWLLAEATLREGYVVAPTINRIVARLQDTRYTLAIAWVLIFYPLASIHALTYGDRLVMTPAQTLPIRTSSYKSQWSPSGTIRKMVFWPFADVSGDQLSTVQNGASKDSLDRVIGVSLFARNLQRIDASFAFLARADLQYADLDNAILNGANLRGALLMGAHLRCAKLAGADLRGANLTGAVLSGADLRNAKLAGADMLNTNLYAADLRGTALQSSDKPKAIIAKNLTLKQLEQTIMDSKTVPPDWVKRKLQQYWLQAPP